MSACEKCWADAGGDMARYTQLLQERVDHPCTPEQQAGEDIDPTPWCSGGHMTEASCTCGEIDSHD